MNNKPQRHIILAVTNDLETDQRVHRACMALLSAGYRVTLIGRRLPSSKPISRPYHTVRMRLLFRKKVWFYVDYNCRLLLRLLFTDADAYYANDTDTLPACYLASRLRHKALFFDAHEMFPEVPELVGRRGVQRVWTRIEDLLIPRVDGACTVCHSIADIYHRRYGITMQVVRNVPPKANATQPEPNATTRPLLTQMAADKAAGLKILLYQGAVNLGRGIEPVMDALRTGLLDDCVFYIVGTGDKLTTLQQEATALGLTNRVHFVGRLPLEALAPVTRMADLGISILQNLGLNYYYSLPNRIADFTHAAVPMLATDFPEIHSVIAHYHIGSLIPSHITDPATADPQRLAQSIRHTLNYWVTLSPDVKADRFRQAADDLCWEHDRAILLQAVSQIF